MKLNKKTAAATAHLRPDLGELKSLAKTGALIFPLYMAGPPSKPGAKPQLRPVKSSAKRKDGSYKFFGPKEFENHINNNCGIFALRPKYSAAEDGSGFVIMDCDDATSPVDGSFTDAAKDFAAGAVLFSYGSASADPRKGHVGVAVKNVHEIRDKNFRVVDVLEDAEITGELRGGGGGYVILTKESVGAILRGMKKKPRRRLALADFQKVYVSKSSAAAPDLEPKDPNGIEMLEVPGEMQKLLDTKPDQGRYKAFFRFIRMSKEFGYSFDSMFEKLQGSSCDKFGDRDGDLATWPQAVRIWNEKSRELTRSIQDDFNDVPLPEPVAKKMKEEVKASDGSYKPAPKYSRYNAMIFESKFDRRIVVRSKDKAKCYIQNKDNTYEECHDNLLAAAISKTDKKMVLTRAHIEDMVKAVKMNAIMLDNPDPKLFDYFDGNGDDKKPPLREIVVAKNGLVHIDRPSELMPHNSDFFMIKAPEVEFKPFKGIETASMWDILDDCPHFTKYLQDCFTEETREEQLGLLQELMGLCLVPDNRLRIIIYVFGRSGGGKSVMSRIMQALIPKRYNSTPGNRIMKDLFSVGGIDEDLVLFVPDATNTATRSGETNTLKELFKIMSGGDEMRMRRMYDEGETKPITARLWITGNELLNITDSSLALANRVMPLNVNNLSFNKQGFKMDEDLSNKIILHELHGVLNFAIQGLHRLRRNGMEFTTGKYIQQMRDRIFGSQSTVYLFLKENYKITGLPKDRILAEDLYQEYETYCIEGDSGFSHYHSISKFREAVENQCPGVEVKRMRKTKDQKSPMRYWIRGLKKL